MSNGRGAGRETPRRGAGRGGGRGAGGGGRGGGGGGPDPGKIVEGARVWAAFAIVGATFLLFAWLIREVVVNHNANAYCDVRNFFIPLCILSFSILGIFLGGWVRTTWQTPGASRFGGLASELGGGVAFALVSAAVFMMLAQQDNCGDETASYGFSFEKPEEVAIEPERDYEKWYQHYPHKAQITHGVLFYTTGLDPSIGDEFQDLTFKLDVGRPGVVLCPINVRIYNRQIGFNGMCEQSVATANLSFKLSRDLAGYASKLATQSGKDAPSEAADAGGPVSVEEKECFAEIKASGRRIKGPFGQTFWTNGRNLKSDHHLTVHLYKGFLCIENAGGEIIFPVQAGVLAPSSSLDQWLGALIPAAHAEEAEPCGSDPPEGPTFDQILRKLASPDADDAVVKLVDDYRRYECRIYDALLDDALSADPNMVARLLKVLYLAPAGWSNNRLITNSNFPSLAPTDKAKRVFDKIITSFIISDDEEVRYQARRVLTTYPAEYMREKFESSNIGQLDEPRRMAFAYAGVFMYFKPVISGEHFTASEMTSEIMDKVITEYKKGVALRDYLDKKDLTDSYVLDFGLASAVRNFEKSDKDALVPAEFKPSTKLFRRFISNAAASTASYPFNNQLGWATCFAYTDPKQSLSPDPKKPLTLDDAEWFKGEIITVSNQNFSLSETEPTPLKACPGSNYANTETSVARDTQVRRLLRKAETDKINWLFVQTKDGFGWLREMPKKESSPLSPS